MFLSVCIRANLCVCWISNRKNTHFRAVKAFWTTALKLRGSTMPKGIFRHTSKHANDHTPTHTTHTNALAFRHLKKLKHPTHTIPPPLCLVTLSAMFSTWICVPCMSGLPFDSPFLRLDIFSVVYLRSLLSSWRRINFAPDCPCARSRMLLYPQHPRIVSSHAIFLEQSMHEFA